MWRVFGMTLAAVLLLVNSAQATAAPVKIKVFVTAAFEIGNPTGDKAGEFQHWYERYFVKDATAYTVKGAENAVYVNKDGVMGTVLGMGKVRSSSTMTAILSDPRFDFSEAYFLVTGCAGSPPTAGTGGTVFWADWVVDYDLGNRWGADEVPPGAPLFDLLSGFEDAQRIQLNEKLAAKALALTKDTPLRNGDDAKAARVRYPQEKAKGLPFVGMGTHLTGDTFFHGPALSNEAQRVSDLNKAGVYCITEMEGVAVGYVVKKFGYGDRLQCLRSVVNFDQGVPGQNTLEYMKESESFPGFFADGMWNVFAVGSRFVDEVVNNWDDWRGGVK